MHGHPATAASDESTGRTPIRSRTAIAVAVAAMIAAAAAGVRWWNRTPAESLPAAFVARVNPRAHERAAIVAGASLFHDNCSSCHGDRADGHGVAAVGLVPPPANFRAGDVLPRHSDAYLFYRLTEGKQGTAMPSFRGALSEDERWAVVTYLRSLR
jgi:mono/diheme cytochrome c family protein